MVLTFAINLNDETVTRGSIQTDPSFGVTLHYTTLIRCFNELNRINYARSESFIFRRVSRDEFNLASGECDNYNTRDNNVIIIIHV